MTALRWSLFLFCAFIYFLLLVNPRARWLNALIASISPFSALPRPRSGEAVIIMSYPQGYLYQPPGSLALYSCPLAAPRSEELARSSSGSAFSPYPGSAAFTASTSGFSSPLSYSTDPATGFPSYMVTSAGAVAIHEALFFIGMHEYCMIGWI